MLILCSCTATEDFSPPDYPVVEKPNSVTKQTVDGYRKPLPQTSSQETVYYANKKSKKFHNPDCTYALKMSDTSALLEKDREKLISDGYSPCGKCNP